MQHGDGSVLVTLASTVDSNEAQTGKTSPSLTGLYASRKYPSTAALDPSSSWSARDGDEVEGVNVISTLRP